MSSHYRIDVDTASLVAAQERLQGLAEALTGRADQLDAAPGTMPVWQGAARTAVMTEVAALAGHTRGFAPMLDAAAEGLGPFITAAVDAETNVLPDLDQRRQSALDAFDDAARSSAAQRTTAYEDIPADAGAQRGMWQMEADSAHQHRVSQSASARDGALAGLDAEYDELVRRLERAAAEASEAVAAAVVTVAPDQTVANALGGGGRMPLVDLYYDLATESRQAGIAAAQELLEQGADASADLITTIAERQDDPAFAAGFASAASPEDLSLMVMQWSGTREAMVSSLSSPEQLQTYDDRYAAVVAAVSRTLGTATRGTGRFSPPEGYTERWVELLTGDLTTEGGAVLLGQSAAASLLLTRGVFATPFLERVATSVYELERSAGGRPVWGPRVSDGSYTGDVVAPYGRSGVDVMANVLRGLGGNAEAAQRFFAGGGMVGTTVLDHDVEVQERLQYLLQDRRWPYDDADGLGAALVAATTVHRAADEAGRVSAVLASQTFALAGEVDEPGAGGRSLQTGLRDDVALMLGTYGADVADVLAPGLSRRDDVLDGVWTSEDPSGGHGALVDKDHLERLVATIGSGGSDDLAVVLSGVAAATNARTDAILAANLAEDPGAATRLITQGHVDDLSLNLGSGAHALNSLLMTGLEGEDDEEAARKARGELAAKVLGAVAAVPGATGGPWTGFFVAQAVDGVKDALTDVALSSDYSGEQSTYGELAEAAVLDSLLRSGYLSQAAYDAAGRPEDAPPPEILTLSADGTPTFTYGSEAFRRWLGGGEPPLFDFLRDNVANPFDAGGGPMDPDD